MTTSPSTSAGGGRFLRGGPPTRATTARALLLLLGGAVLLLVLAPLTGENGLSAYWRLRKENRALETRVAALREEAAALEARIESLKDPEQLEKYAREHYGAQLPGETVYQMVPGEAAAAATGP